MTDLPERLKAEEELHREGAQSKAPYVHRTPEQCGRTADLLKEAREAARPAPTTAFEAEHPGYCWALGVADSGGKHG